MKNDFNKRYQQMEAERVKLFEELKQYPDDMINKKPSPNAWSVAEVFNHLMTAEEATLHYLRKKTQDVSKSGNAGLQGLGRYMVLKIAFLLPLKFKAPPVTMPNADFISLKDIDQKWAAIRKETSAIINSLSDADLKKALWRHPIAGKMNLFQMVDFFTLHFERHRGQVYRTLKSVKD